MAKYSAKALKTAIDIADAGKREPVAWTDKYFSDLKEQFGGLFDEIIKAFISNMAAEGDGFVYRCSATSPTENGSGMVSWSVQAVDPNGFYVPGYDASFETPYEETNTAIKSANPGDAISLLFVTYRPSFWDVNTIMEFQTSNYNALVSKDGVDVVINELGGYPYDVPLVAPEPK